MSNRRTEPASGFAGFALSPTVRRGIDAAGFVDPRPIQAQTIPAALEGRDILGLAQTGTGKTAAFALPVLERILASPSRAKGPQALIVAPTRELATQISEEIRLLAQFTRLEVATVFGGVSIHAQVTALRKDPAILVACPGRLLDLLGQRVVRLDGIVALVLDEADHMFDMGFLPDVRRILAALPARRQNLLFSATMPPEIRRLADGLLRDPHVVELDYTKPIATVRHTLFPVDGTRKFDLLERVLAEDDFVSAIVFTRTKHRAKKLARQLDDSGHSAVALQGNMSQNQRERAMEGFRARRFQVLVATDIAARGIDVDQVSHVVNFDMPTTADGYTHRIGRTGRSERQGRAYTFVTPEDSDLVRAVEKRIGSAIPRRLVDGLGGAAPAPGRAHAPVRGAASTSARAHARGTASAPAHARGAASGSTHSRARGEASREPGPASPHRPGKRRRKRAGARRRGTPTGAGSTTPDRRRK
jgi:ATP-dependent RNA helicase RhlE